MTPLAGGPWIAFSWDGTDYALDVFDVVELLSARVTTPIPGAGERLAGITTWRGRTLPVLDIRPSLKTGGVSPDLKKRMIVLRRPSMFALRLDAPGRILDPEELQELTVESGEADQEMREQGIQLARCRDGWVRLLDPKRLLGGDPLVVGGEAPGEDTP